MTDTRTADPAQTAYDAAELVRQLNHETLNGVELSAPEISRIVGHLADLVDRLPQAFEQLSHQLGVQQDKGKVRMEDGRDAAAPVTAVKTLLEQAAALCEPANRTRYGAPASPFNHALHNAHGRLFHMGGFLEPDDED